MRRKINALISIEALKHLKYLPIIISEIKNWFSFILNYIGFSNSAELYKFRNGIKIEIAEGVDAATIAVIFIKREYGIMPDNSVIIDIGGGIGVFSIFAAFPPRKNNIVYAYEPASTNFHLLRKNIEQNKLDSFIKPFNLGVGAKSETRRLYLSNSPFHSLYRRDKKQSFIDIKCTSLKDIFEKNKIDFCHLLKIDCEGAEFEILYNTPDEYFNRIKEIRMEYHNHFDNKNYNISCLKKFLEEKGFKIIKYKEESYSLGQLYSGQLWVKR